MSRCCFDKQQGYQDLNGTCLPVNRATWKPAPVSRLYSQSQFTRSPSPRLIRPERSEYGGVSLLVFADLLAAHIVRLQGLRPPLLYKKKGKKIKKKKKNRKLNLRCVAKKKVTR